MDCSLGRHRNPFCYIFSLACLLLPVCMWWRDVISAQSAETSDNSHQAALVCTAFTARTGTPWAWRRSTWGIAQKNISLGAAGVEKHRAWLREEAGSGCQLMLSMEPHWCHKARRYWSVPSRNVVWKFQRGLWYYEGLGLSNVESEDPLIWLTMKVDSHYIPCPVPIKLDSKMPYLGCS